MCSSDLFPSHDIGGINGSVAALALVTPSTASANVDGRVAAYATTSLNEGAGPNLKRNTTLILTLLRDDLAEVQREVSFSSGATPGTTASVAAVKATLTINPTGDNNSVLYEAVTAGESGNDITITYSDPGIPSQSLSVSVNSQAITVNLETDSDANIVSTADEIIAAIGASGAASALVTASNVGFGHGYVTAVSATNMTGGLERERFLSIVDVDVEGGEKGDVFVVNNEVERTITY